MGDYCCIVADPPWREKGQKMFAPTRAEKKTPDVEWRYNFMNYDEIEALAVGDLAADEAHLYLWATQRSLERAFAVVRAWGFDYKQTLTWCKQMGLGFHYYRNSTEFFLFATRGNLKTTSRDVPTHFLWPRGEHSAKPDAFYDMVERESPEPRLELFSRRARIGWDVWGDQVGSTVDVKTADLTGI